MKTNRQWLKNISYSLMSKAAALVFLFLADIAAARMLAIELYAEWTFFFSLLSMLFWIGWCGINISSKVYVSKCVAMTEKALCVRSAAAVRMAASVVIALMIALILPGLSPLFGFPDKYPDLNWLFFMAAFLVFFNGITEFFKEVFMGLDRFRDQFIITAIEYGSLFFFILPCLQLSRSVHSIAYAYMLSGMITIICGCWLMRKYFTGLSGSSGVDIRRYAGPILRYALPLALIGIGGVILVEMDTFMLGLLGTKGDVAAYGIAKNICSKAIHINNAFMSGVMITFSLITAENYRERKAEFRKAMIINSIITVVVAVLLIGLSDTAIAILYGDRYLRSGHIIRLLSLYYFFLGISTFLSGFLDFRNKAASRSVWYLSVILINLVLNYLWIPAYGADGAAWATGLSLIPYTIYAFIACLKEWRTISPPDHS